MDSLKQQYRFKTIYVSTIYLCMKNKIHTTLNKKTEPMDYFVNRCFMMFEVQRDEL